VAAVNIAIGINLHWLDIHNSCYKIVV